MLKITYHLNPTVIAIIKISTLGYGNIIEKNPRYPWEILISTDNAGHLGFSKLDYRF
jgi:hypothetical protein